MSTKKKIIIAIVVILILIGGFLVYKKFSKKEPAASVTPPVVTPDATAPVTSGINKEALLSEQSELTKKLAAERYKLYNMNNYIRTITADKAQAYTISSIDPQQAAIRVIENRLGEIANLLNA